MNSEYSQTMRDSFEVVFQAFKDLSGSSATLLAEIRQVFLANKLGTPRSEVKADHQVAYPQNWKKGILDPWRKSKKPGTLFGRNWTSRALKDSKTAWNSDHPYKTYSHIGCHTGRALDQINSTPSSSLYTQGKVEKCRKKCKKDKLKNSE